MNFSANFRARFGLGYNSRSKTRLNMKSSAFALLAFSVWISCRAWAISPEIPTLSYDVYTSESIISVGNSKYRKVEYRGETFYFRLLEAESPAQDLEFSCSQRPFQENENQVLISSAVTKRSSLFVSGLRQTCEEFSSGQKKMNLDPNIQVGFLLDDSKKSLLKNKKVFFMPGRSLIGVGGEW